MLTVLIHVINNATDVDTVIATTCLIQRVLLIIPQSLPPFQVVFLVCRRQLLIAVINFVVCCEIEFPLGALFGFK